MRKGKNAIRRMAALVCSVALLATLLPAQVLAADDVTSGPAVTLTTLNEGEEGSGQEDGNTQPEPEVSCTKSEDCQADTHEEDCPKNGAQDEESTTEPEVSCTKSEDCQAEIHEEGCPKNEAQDEDEGTTEPEVSCTKSEDCQAETHEEGCPKNEARDEEGSTEPEVSCTKTPDCQAKTHEEGCPKYEEKPSAPAVNGDETGNTPAEPQEEKPEFMALDLTDEEEKISSPIQLDVNTAEQFYALADILAAGKIADDPSPTEKQQADMTTLGFSDVKDAAAYNEAFDQVQTATLNITGEISLEDNFEGIGTIENPFKGNVYGNGHTITMKTNVENTNSSSDDSGNAAVALFAYVDTSSGALVFDQITTAGSVTVSGTCDYTAALIGYAQGTNQLTVSKCINNAAVTNTSIKTTWNPYAAASGMVGYTAAPLMMTECTNNGNISSSPDLSGKDMTSMYNVGAAGLVVYAASGTVQNCENTGTILVDSSNMRYAGGLVCKMGQKETESTIVGCKNKGEVRVQNSTTPSATGSKVYAGGIVALMEQTSTNAITECSNYADITVYSGTSNNDVNWNHQMVGGIAGDAAATYDKCSNEGDITVEVHMGCVMCVGGIAGGQQKTFVINNSTNSGNIYTQYEETKTPSYSCIGGIIGLVYKLDSSGCVNTGNITSSIGKTISYPTYIGSVLGKNDSASCWTVDNFTSDCSVTVTNAGTGIVGVGGVTGGPSVGSVASSRVDTHVEITSTAPTYVGGVCGYETSVYATSVEDSTLMLDAKLNSDNSENGYLGGIAGRGSASAKDTTAVLLSEGFGTIRPYIGQKASGQHSLELVNYVVYSNQPFDEKESEDNTVGEPICAILNGGSFAADTQFTAGTLATPTKNGAIFEGWYDSADFTGAAVTTAEAGETYYAKWLDLGVADVSLEYRQTQTFTAPAGVTFSNWKSEDPSVATVDNGTITAVGVGETTISVEAAANGQTTVAKISVTVTPMNITFGTGTGENPGGTITYQYNGGQAPAFSQFATFYPASISDGSASPVVGSSAVTLAEGKDIVFNYDAGAGSNDYEYLPLNVTSEANPEKGLPVTVKLLNENYRFVTTSNVTPGTELRLSVVVTDENLTESALTGLGTPTLTFTYDGTGKAAVTGLTGISADNISEFTLHFHAWHGTEFAEQHLTGKASAFTDEAVAKIAPTEPGSYLMILTGVSENHYTYQSWIMTINKATVTITAADKTVIKGDTDGLPSLNDLTEGKDYTVTGLAAGHSLTTAPTLNYADGANVNTVATYSIVPSGAAADEKYYTIQYVNGTLHVEEIAIIEGADQTWTQGSGSDLVIRSNADFSDFVGVTVNGKTLVENQDYTARSGSTIVTIKAAYLESLAVGDYQIAIVSQTGTAATQFAVKATAAGDTGASDNTGTTSNADSTPAATRTPAPTAAPAPAATAAPAAASAAVIPQTGDTMPVGLLGGVAVIAAAAFVVLLVLRKRKDNH